MVRCLTWLSSLDVGLPQIQPTIQPLALGMDSKKSDDADIDTAFTKYSAPDLDVDDPPSSPDSDGGKILM